MFEVSADDINQLNDVQLRELVGRLCEAEVVAAGHSASTVEWGGSQTAKDGGVDVRVSLPAGTAIGGFIPRASTGFQVKKPDMPRKEIIEEMKPDGVLRPSIHELIARSGAYIIASSTGSTADTALKNRNAAMREALVGVADADRLHTEFFDRQRLTTWTRQYSGVTAWVLERVGKGSTGWRPFGDWSGNGEAKDATYLLDDKLRLHLGGGRDSTEQSIVDAIDELRDELATVGRSVRLVGLSGVGKTRLAQALFDERIGGRALARSLAVYTNLNDNPNPQPVGLAADLIAQGRRTILVVDNCPPDLHGRLTELCGRAESKVSLLTVEYDVRDDRPERTRVVSLETSSNELIEKLIRRRFNHISQVDAHSIAEASGGNARIAVAIADTVAASETVAGLSSTELFDRLLLQRHGSNDQLARTAQACSLIYSFNGEDLNGDEAELPNLAALAGLSVDDVYRQVKELQRRELVQQRSKWRAVLPHAFANRLAIRALQETHPDQINRQLLGSRNVRLATSFSRRLSYLHDQPEAVRIVEEWLSPGGLLGDVRSYDLTSKTMFTNVAPVSVEATLCALERVESADLESTAVLWTKHRKVLRSIAFEASLFERCCRLLSIAATRSTNDDEAKKASDAFTSMFTVVLSGTHATMSQRLAVVEPMLKSSDEKEGTLALRALGKMLEAGRFSTDFHFSFGARPRDYGYLPRGDEEIKAWFDGVLAFAERLALVEGVQMSGIRAVVAKSFSNLWQQAQAREALERLSRKFAADDFWREGWAAATQAQRLLKRNAAENIDEDLAELEKALRPLTLVQRVRALVLGPRVNGLDYEDDRIDPSLPSAERPDAIARHLGIDVAADRAALEELLPELVVTGTSIGALTGQFSRSLALEVANARELWDRLSHAFLSVEDDRRSTVALRGFLSGLGARDSILTEEILDQVEDHPILKQYLAELQTSVGVDARGFERLARGLKEKSAPLESYRYLYFGRLSARGPAPGFSQLVSLISREPGGFEIALELVSSRLDEEDQEKVTHPVQTLETGRMMLRDIVFDRYSQTADYLLSRVAKSCLEAHDQGAAAADVATQLRQAVAKYEVYAIASQDLLKTLLTLHPSFVLDAIFSGDEDARQAGIEMFDHRDNSDSSAMDVVPLDVLLSWCGADANRFIDAASVVAFVGSPDHDGAKNWTAQAASLLSHAPDPRPVIEALVERFAPSSWSGSRAALIESNSRLLEGRGWMPPASLATFIAQKKVEIRQRVSAERASETARDRLRDERFE